MLSAKCIFKQARIRDGFCTAICIISRVSSSGDSVSPLSSALDTATAISPSAIRAIGASKA